MFWLLKHIVNAPLNRDRKFAAVFGFAKWQFLSRIHDGKIVINWIDDARIIVGNGETGLTGNIYTGLTEFDDMAFLLSALRSDDVFLDVGANVGIYTIMASKLCGVRSFTFEPVPSTFDRLLDQINLNRIGALATCMNVGVGSAKGRLSFTVSQDTTNRAATAGYTGEIVDVDVVMLDDFEIDCRGDILLKIDVEGFEMNVLRGAEKLLSDSRTQGVILELNGSGKAYGFSDDDIHKKMLDLGFHSVDFDGKTREMNPSGDYNKGGNTIYVKDLKRMTQRCLAGPKRVVHTVGGAVI